MTPHPSHSFEELRKACLTPYTRRVERLPCIAVRPDVEFDAFVSRTTALSLHSDAFVDEWIDQARNTSHLGTSMVPLGRVERWNCDKKSGNITHRTGRFFSIIGIHARHRLDHAELEWDQPIIEQPETGILGILAHRIDGILHVCLQAKEEPGNIGAVQLSPTIQATYSNYTKAHGGSSPPFLDLFVNPGPGRCLFSRLQTEDGGRFLRKSNRNMIVSAADDFPVTLPEGFIWLTLRQVAELMHRDNLINACARSILSSLVFAGSGLATPEKSTAILDREIFDAEAVRHAVTWLPTPDGERTLIASSLQWLDNRKSVNHIIVQRKGLKELNEWHFDGKGFFSHKEGRFFRIVGLRVSSDTREVGSWCQPIIENPTPGIIGLLVRNGSCGREILMQTKAELGNKDIVQIGPTVQFTPGNYASSKKLVKPFLFREFSDPKHFSVVYEGRQAEEGARFYRECHLHRILMLPDGMNLDLPDNFYWLPVRHISFLLHLGEKVNSCARSILACLL